MRPKRAIDRTGPPETLPVVIALLPAGDEKIGMMGVGRYVTHGFHRSSP
jgi:hypothetical protein